MRILADANLEAAIVAVLRGAGHDVYWAAIDAAPATSDEELADVAEADSRVIITHDRDFGELVFRLKKNIPGVLLLRLESRTEAERTAAFLANWPAVEPRLEGHFIVATEKRLRWRPMPRDGWACPESPDY